MVHIITKKEDVEKLPESIDFHKATASSYLSTELKSKLQIKLSKMNQKGIREMIVNLELMEMDSIKDQRLKNRWEKVRDRLIRNIEIGEKLKSELFSEDERLQIANAMYFRACRDFAEKYLYSVKKQKRV